MFYTFCTVDNLKGAQKGPLVPFNVEPDVDCADCPYGYCVEYVGDQEFKDRNTAFRLNQTPGWKCAFDSFVPGFENDPFNEDYDFYVQQLIENATNAGDYLFETDHWGDITPEEFFYTAQQTGKVKGDSYEFLVRAILWNCCAYWNQYMKSETWELDQPTPDTELDEPIGVITLGDNYDIQRLFTSEFRTLYLEIMDQLEEQGTNLSLSTPDAVVFRTRNLPEEKREYFEEVIDSINEDEVERLEKSREHVEGHLVPSDIIAAIGIKTSIRSDRLYQLIFEANAWHTIFRTLFGADSQRYYTMTTQSYGANEQKVNDAVWLPSIHIADGEVHAQPAIEDVINMMSPQQTIDWFFEHMLETASIEGELDLNQELLDSLGITIQQDLDEFA